MPVQYGLASHSLTTRCWALDVKCPLRLGLVWNFDYKNDEIKTCSNEISRNKSDLWMSCVRWIDFWTSFWQLVLGRTSCLRSTCQLQGMEGAWTGSLLDAHQCSGYTPPLSHSTKLGGSVKCFGVPKQRRPPSHKRKDIPKWKRGILQRKTAILKGRWWGAGKEQALLLVLHEYFLSEIGHQKLPLPTKCFFNIPGPWKQFYYIIRIQGALGPPVWTFAGQHHVKKGIVKEWYTCSFCWLDSKREIIHVL